MRRQGNLYVISASIHTHFQPIPHESPSHSIGYEHTSSIVEVFLMVGLFCRRFGDAPPQLLVGLLLEKGKHLCQDGIISITVPPPAPGRPPPAGARKSSPCYCTVP